MVKYLEDSAKKEGNEVMEIKESESDNKKLIRPVKTEVEQTTGATGAPIGDVM